MFRYGSNGYLPPIVSSWPADFGQRGCGQQLCPRTLYGWPRDCRRRLGSNQTLGRELCRPPGIPRLPLIWRRFWLGIYFAAHGTSLSWIWQEKQTPILHLSSASGLNPFSLPDNANNPNIDDLTEFYIILKGVDGRCWALQFDPNNAYHSRAFRLCFHGGQWSHLRHLSSQSVHRTSDLYKSQSIDRSDRIVYYGLASIWRRSQCRSDRVSDQSRALSTYSLPPGDVRTNDVGRESLSRTTQRGRNHVRNFYHLKRSHFKLMIYFCLKKKVRLFWTQQSNGQVRSSQRQVHGRVSSISRRCCA